MSNLITINNQSISIKEYKGKRVCTFKDIDLVHQRPAGTAKRNFTKNRKYFVEGEDYFLLSKEEALSTKFVLSTPTGLTIITESGYLMLAKSFTDDLAWEVQRQLVNSYFRATPSKTETVRQRLEQEYLIALKNADQAKDLKKYFYNLYRTNEREYRRCLDMEKTFTREVERLKHLINTEIQKDISGVITNLIQE